MCGLIETVTAESAPGPETGTTLGRTAQAITACVTFSPSEITFQNGKSLPLTHGGQILFRAETKKAMADLYTVISPDDPAVGKREQGVLGSQSPIWSCVNPTRSERGRSAAPRHPFSGPKLTAGSPDDGGLSGRACRGRLWRLSTDNRTEQASYPSRTQSEQEGAS